MMHFVTKVRMETFCTDFMDVRQVDELFVLVCGKEEVCLTKEAVYDFLVFQPDSIRVGTFNGPPLKPVMSEKGEKYVRSLDIDCRSDALMGLSRALPDRL